jgi:solute carrier family 25 folate transporter 32
MQSGAHTHLCVFAVKADGVRGLYAGMSPNVVGAGASWGFYFFFYNIAKSSLQVPLPVPM